jgi:Rha family phage regulatory protein
MEVAEMVNKDHKELLRDIRRYQEQLNESKIAPVDFFTESTYQDSKNEKRPCFLVTKKGCEFIAHKLTGIKGTEFTAKYINRFHEMEETILNGFENLSTEMQALIMHDKKIQAVIYHIENQDKKITDVDQDLQTFKKDMPLLGVELDKIKHARNKKIVPLLGGKSSQAYNDKPLRTKVYEDSARQIWREFGVSSFKELKHCQLDLAINIISKYELPLFLAEEIENANAQMSM